MAKKQICIYTERLYIVPMTEEELRVQIENEQDEDTRNAYMEMLNNYLNEPEDYLWFLPWKIVLKDSGKAIGNVGFLGPQTHGAVEIGYGILPSHRKQGYMREAAEAIVRWAFTQHDVYIVTAETSPDNKDSRSMLESIGFTMYANGQEGPRFMRTKKAIPYSLMIVPICLAIGLAAGFLLSKLITGVLVGVGLGLLIGLTVDFGRMAKRKRITSAYK